MLRIQILGTRGLVEEKSKDHSKHTGLLLYDDETDEALLLDCGEEEFLNTSKRLKCILLTHGHPDHIGGIESDPGIAVFVHPFSKSKTLPEFVKFVSTPVLIDIGKHKIRASFYPVYHSTRAPATAICLEIISKDAVRLAILFAPDFISFRKEKPQKVSYAFVDGSSFLRPLIRKSADEPVGHASTLSIIRSFQKTFKGLSLFSIIHFGSASITDEERQSKALKIAVGEETATLGFCKDGQNFGIEGLFQTLSEERIFLKDFLQFIKEMPNEILLYKDYFSLVGSLPVSGIGHDADILIRGEELRAAVFRFLHLFPPNLVDKIHIFRDVGPFTSYIPLADLVLKIRTPNLEKMELSERDLKREGQISRRKDEVRPFRFFFMQKTKAGYHKREVFTEEEAKEMLKDAPFPWLADIKADGMHCQVHKVKDRIEFYSEDGKILNSNQFPELLDALRKIPHDFIACGELEIWLPSDLAEKYKIREESRRADSFYHLGRSDVAGYIHSKRYNPDLAKHLLLNFYDLLWLDGKDIHRLELRARRAKLEATFKQLAKPPKLFGFIRAWVIKKPADLTRIWRAIRRTGYAEGLMLKPLRGEESKYILWHQGGLWIKLKSLYEMTCQILAKKESKSSETGKPLGVWRYLCAIRGPRRLVPVGWTYATKEKFDIGERIEVRFQNLNKYTDPKTGEIWYNWWRPTVVSKEPEKKPIDTYIIADRLVKATAGEIKTRVMPKDVREHLPSVSASELAKVAKQPPIPDDFRKSIDACTSLTISKLKQMDKTGKYSFPPYFGIMQLHFRGKSVHIDFRHIGEDQKEGWEGFTILNQVEGIPDSPVTSIDAARDYREQLFLKKSEISKVYPGMQPNEGFMVVPKFEGKSDQLGWLCFVEKVVEWPHAGATKEFPGVFIGLDWGYVKKTVDKGWFREYWLFFNHFKGRLVLRQLKTQPGFKKAGRFKMFWRGLFASPESPPYIFSRSFFDKIEVIPTTSMLPPHWEALIPNSEKWWDAKLSKSERLKRIKQAYNRLIEEGYLSGRKIELSSSAFVVQKVYWRGPIHVRAAAQTQYVFRFIYNNRVWSFWSRSNYLTAGKRGISTLSLPTSVPPNRESPKDWLTFEGKIPASHPDNPNKELDAFCEILLKGSASSIELTKAGDFRLRLESELLRGYCSLVREQGTDFYLWRMEDGED